MFLAVKKAYDVLSDHTKRSAYDSTALPFDDSIPAPRTQLINDPLLLYKDEDFYDLFGPVFQRNLRFDANLRPDAPGVAKKNKNNNRNKEAVGKGFQPPSFGDDNTPIEEVHKFYEYWIHFDSWRDFTAQATDELQVENELENAESRFEKRWLQKEVDKRARQLKTKENGRIQSLVERAMEADPRLRRERQALQEAKEKAKAERAAMAERKKKEEEEARIEAERQAEEEKRKRAEEKVIREQEKKQIRKARQQLRRMTSSSFEESPAVWADSYDMGLDVDYLCTSLNLEDLRELNEEYSEKTEEEGGSAALSMIRERALQQRDGKGKNTNGDKQTSSESNATKNTPEASNSSAKKNPQSKVSKSKPWTKDELSALAKAVKKYPPGGASRWDQITLFVNNLCKQDDPRSREECIQKYNDVTKAAASATSSSASKAPPPAPAQSPPAASESEAPSKENTQQEGVSGTNDEKAADSSTPSTNGGTNGSSSEEDVWTPEQDQQLQAALAKYPATMEKNARWTAIAEAVPGKSKKLCVQRFKAIREALKNRK